MLGYTYWHQLFFFHDISYISFIALFFYIDYSVIFYFSLSCCYCLHTVYMHEHLPFFKHLIRSLLTIMYLHIQISDAFLNCSGIRWARTLREELEFLPIWFWYSCLLWFLYIRFSLYSSSLFIWYHAWMLIYDIAVIVDLLWFRFVACFGLPKT